MPLVDDKGRAPRKHRETRYGLPTEKEATVSKKKSYSKGNYKSYVPTFKPVSDENTPYGPKKFRTPTRAKQYTGTQGSAQLVAVLDIDGTMQTWGSGLDGDLKKWCAKLYKDYPDIIFLIVTARDHEWMYETSFNWVMHNFPWAFIGPFCRAKDDPRYASEFKRELCQGFEDMGLYQVIAAADDNAEVIKMWKYWAETHFEDPKDFDLLECDSYGDYLGYRSYLPSKGYSTTTPVTSTYSSAYASTSDSGKKVGVPQRWVNGTYVDGKYIKAHWEDINPVHDPFEGKHREAGTSRYEVKDITTDPAWGHYLAERYGAPNKPNKVGSWPSGSLNVVSESPQTWGDKLDAVIDEIDSETALYRQDLEDMVAHMHPDWTPVRIADMSNAELRREAGIGDEDYRQALYGQIANVFGSHCCDDELDELDIEDIEEMLDMTREEIDARLEEEYQARQKQPAAPVISSLDLDNIDPESIGMTVEEFNRRRARMDLEDLVLSLRQYLTLPEVERMDAKELEAIVNAVEAESEAANADEAQVVMLDGEVAV